MEKKAQRKIDRKQILVLAGFALCMLIFLWRSFYSVNYGDEPYCISSVWRFYKGDALLAEDWFPAQQLIAWILYPLFWLFRLFTDSNDGIILASRIAYVLFQGIVSVIIYMRLNKYQRYRIPAVMMYLLFTQNNMLTLNYNTLGIGCMLVSLTILMNEEVYRKRTLILVGVLIAVMILSQPYAILMFLLWGAVVFAGLLIGSKRELHPLLKFRTFFYVGLGAFLVLLVFAAVVLSRAGISEIQNGLQYLTGDPEHQMDIQYKVSKYFERFYRYYKYQILAACLSLLVGCFKESLIVRIMKIESLILSYGAAVYSLIYHGWISDYVPIDFICVPMTFLGISVWALGKVKNKKLFFGWMIPALLYTFCVQLTTNTGILAVSSACIVASVGGVLLIGDSIERQKESLTKTKYQILLFMMVGIFVLQGVLLMYHRINDTWWSDPVEECTELIERGPAKGIYTSKEDAEEYYDTLEKVDTLCLKEDDSILFLELEPMLYLYADLPAATYSTWTIGEENYLEEYYHAYPERMPTVVCWVEAETKNEASGIQYFLENDYQFIEIKEGIALRKNK